MIRLINRKDFEDVTILVLNGRGGVFTLVNDASGNDYVVTPGGQILDCTEWPRLPKDANEVLTWVFDNI